MQAVARRWTQRDLTAEQRSRMDKTARAERAVKDENLARGITTLGGGRAPLRLEVLDAETVITYGVVELKAAVCERLGLTPRTGVTPVEAITRMIGLLDRIAAHEDLAEHVLSEARAMNSRAGHVLGDAEPVVRLDARCPICSAKSLRAFPDRELVVCVNGSCRCEDEGCGCRLERPVRHRWEYHALAVELGDVA
ncbi:hypothetical protein PS9374_04551 [Planomonospora sphaerica]|uniref:Uncharacterized protein n=1 Tax=Planomonospora sphaerica TaxID=161355 RepID=A0A171DJ60_9ACTN|nr:hypothetical protein [Planomonospora sphaerica]GAT68886.1 hypothetical protein PS9374_04551 [Planomonospora sphaerica]